MHDAKCIWNVEYRWIYVFVSNGVSAATYIFDVDISLIILFVCRLFECFQIYDEFWTYPLVVFFLNFPSSNFTNDEKGGLESLI
jgi:hypothetical protein